MSINKPAHFTSEEILSWISNNKDNPFEVFNFLTQCRIQNLGDNFPQKPLDTTDLKTKKQRCYDTICHALLTNDLKTINLDRLKEAKNALADPTMIDPNVILKIVEFILQVILIIIKYFEAHPLLSAKKNDVEFLNLLKDLNGKNPLINLPNISIENATLNNVNLSGINLEGATFLNTSMKNAKFDNSRLRDSQFEWCDLSESCFYNADLSWSRMANNLTEKATGISNRNLIDYLKTDLDQKPAFSPPSKESLDIALKSIHDDLKSEKNLENNALHRLENKMKRHNYHEMVANNIVKLADQIADPRAQHDMLVNMYNHHFFAGHRTAHMAKGLDTFIHRLFKVKGDLPVVSSHNQHIIKRALKALEEKMAETKNQPDPVPPRSYSRH